MLTRMLYANAERLPRHTALVYADERISHAELLERVERLAHGLRSLGIAPGHRIALVLPNALAFLISFYAIARLGGVVVPLNPQFSEEELEYYFRDCRVQAIITDGSGVRLCKAIISRWDAAPVSLITTGPEVTDTISFRNLAEEQLSASFPWPAAEEEVVFQYSSGSTGRPKRVARTQHQCWSEVENFKATSHLNPEDTIFCTIPLFHTHGMGNCLLAASGSGGTLVILEDPNPFIFKRDSALELLERERATVFPGVPFIFRHLAETPRQADLSALRLCFSAGSHLPHSTFESFYQKFGIPIRQLYGCTEAGAVSINLDADPLPTSQSVGHPLENVKLMIVDDGGNPLPMGQVGEVVTSSPAMTQGYFEMDELNRQAFRNGCFYTGDLGRVDNEGRLYITGRKKLFIEVLGHKVDPVEVEDILATHPHVREVVVVGVKGQVEGEELVKAVIVADGACEERELIELCQRRLASYKVPQIVEFRDEVPKSPLGKVLRKYLV